MKKLKFGEIYHVPLLTESTLSKYLCHQIYTQIKINLNWNSKNNSSEKWKRRYKVYLEQKQRTETAKAFMKNKYKAGNWQSKTSGHNAGQ